MGATAVFVAQQALYMDFGKWTPFVAIICSIIVNIGRKMNDGPSQPINGMNR